MARPCSRRMDGSQPRTWRSRVFSLLRPRTPCGPSKFMTLLDLFAGNARDQIHQPVDRDQFLRPQVERIVVFGGHDPDQPFHTVVHIHKRARLLAVSPNLKSQIRFPPARLCG